MPGVDKPCRSARWQWISGSETKLSVSYPELSWEVIIGDFNPIFGSLKESELFGIIAIAIHNFCLKSPKSGHFGDLTGSGVFGTNEREILNRVFHTVNISPDP